MIAGLTMFCDACRTPAYTSHASCRECSGDFCEAHIVPGSLVGEEGKALCLGCELEGRTAGMNEPLSYGSFELVNDAEGESHGVYASRGEAIDAAAFARLKSYTVWSAGVCVLTEPTEAAE